MLKRIALLASVAIAFAVVVYASADKPADESKQLPVPEMKFNDVKEIAPGVFFRYSSIAANDPKIPFGGSNHTWVVFKDYVVVIDANFPKEAADVIADIKKTTKKPIKYVLDTHHHGDHAYGNTIWAKEGAQIVAHKNAARLLKANGPKQWEDAAKDRKDIKDNELKQVDISFDDKYELKDETQHVVFMHFGHSHTSGDASAYLPKHKILCTGDACVNGAFNYMGHSNSASWIKCLDAMGKLEIDLICPGHGKVARKDLLAKETRYFTELRAAVKKGIEDKKSVEEITKGLDFPWYKEWTGVNVVETDMNKDSVKHVYNELMGKIDHDRIGAAPSPLNWRPAPTGIAGK
ncbi:MBL fold metallo-hydrolase [Gemmata sp. G18]|uniref:MBL fold metallo-hydrolase n=1 Tax=Gemmata palustris TaxID=2822762 RepID=A0ABS5C137_9BACT|nr:MBL fold metallo-hydrolase [Gemmata palustris]MBP3959695.1 MBL fold metallo-hydrolase [Gemmata palustris]